MFEKNYGLIGDKYVTGSGSQVRIWRSSNQLNVASDERFGLLARHIQLIMTYCHRDTLKQTFIK